MRNMKDSLPSHDLLSCASIFLKMHWVIVIIDEWSRILVGVTVNTDMIGWPHSL